MVVALGAGLLVAASCKKTVEGENQAWTNNLAQVQTLAATYPGFANALHEQQKTAEAAMAAARELSDKEASAKKMADANSLLSDGFVSTLSRLDSRQKELRGKLITASMEAEHAADAAGAKAATDDAQRILRNLDDALKAGAPDAATATAVLRKIDGDLSTAASNVDRVLAAAKARKAELAKANGATGATTPANGAAAPAAPAVKVQWKCSYCNNMNDDSRTKCEHCGAPRSAPKAPKPAPPAAKKK
jgi:hypothetical protein